MIVSGGVPTNSPTQVAILSDTTPMWANAQYYARTSVSLSGLQAAYGALYRQQLWVGVVVRKLAMLTARIPLDLKTQFSVNEQRPQPGALADLLARPNPTLSGFKLWLWTSATKSIYGEAFWLKIRGAGGQVRELHPMHPANTVVRRRDDGSMEYVYMSGGTYSTSLPAYPASEIVAFTNYNPDTLNRGMSNLESLRATLLNEDASRRAQSSFWQKGARPSVVLTHPQTVSEQAAARIRAGWDASQRGADNMGGTVLLEEGVVPHVLQLSSEDMQYIEGRKLNREEVAAAFDIPPPAIHILDHATFCLPAGVVVSTLRGPIQVDDVVESDIVFGYDGQGLVPAKVAWAGQTGVMPVYTIRTANRTVQATANHPFLVGRRPLLGGTGPRSRYGLPELVYVRADELTEGDLLVAAHGYNQQHGGRTAPNGRALTVEFMEFAGHLLGNGSMDPINGTIGIAHADNARYIAHYLHCADVSFTQRGGRPLVFGKTERASRFTSISAVREMVDLGFGGTAHTKRIPEWVFDCAPDLRSALLRGMFDADGSATPRGRVDFTLCNLPMVQQFRELCMGLGVPVTNLHSATKTVTLPDGQPFLSTSHKFTATDPGANARIGSHDPRDVERFTRNTPFQESYYQYPDRAGRTIPAPAGCQLSRIKSISFDPTPVPVFDLTIDGLHSFVADGLVVHNSNITEQLRSVYRDTMAPEFEQYESVLDHQLVPDFYPPTGPKVFTRFNMDEVLRGDFEVRAAAVLGLVDHGILTPNEGRPMFGQAPYPDKVADKLFANAAMVPLGSPAERVSITASEPATPAQQGEVAEVIGSADATAANSPIKRFTVRAIRGRIGFKANTPAEQRKALVAEHTAAVRAFFDRQRPGGRKAFTPGDWDTELAALLVTLGQATAETIGGQVAKALGGGYTLDELSGWLATEAAASAGAINQTTANQIQAAIDQAETDGEDPDTAVADLFGGVLPSRADQIGTTRVAIVAGYATVDAGRQNNAATKTWIVTSNRPRPSHSAMSGETCGLDESFSNGMNWPGDPAGGVDEVAGCTCMCDVNTA